MAADKTSDELKAINSELQKQVNLYKSIGDSKKTSAIQDETAGNFQRQLNELYQQQAKSLNKSVGYQEKLSKKIAEIEKQQKDYIDSLKKENDLYVSGVKARQRTVDLGKTIVDQLKQGWTFLQSQDKIIKSTILNLGMSGMKADMMRTSFEQSAVAVARLGGSLEDTQKIMEGFAEETGRSRALSAEMVTDITAIGKGTGLGIEGATKLAAQFELMGVDAKSSMNYVQGVVDTSERMGVNTTKVLKNISDNFKKLNTFNFQQGTKGFAQMAEYAEKFKIDISDALNAATTARTLEGAIDMVAKLQVMGGEFAKMDMFETLYFARNDPKKLQEKISDMTKGLVTLRKTSDDTFEKFISPADRDRLEQAGKALGISADKMTEMSERAFDMQKMNQQEQGLGLTEKQKQLVEGAAIMNTKTGRFEVQLAGQMRDISSLTKDQASSFEKEQVTLKERAKQAMTFDETFKVTINELKASLLPLLSKVNWLLEHTIKPIADMASHGWGIAGAAATLIGAAVAWKSASFLFNKGVENFIRGGVGNIFKSSTSKGGGGFLGKVLSGEKAVATGEAEAGGAGASPSFGSGVGAGLKSLGAGAGVGVAAAGIGEGINLAAQGISKLADSLSKLDTKQLIALPVTVAAMSLSFYALAPALAVAGAAGWEAAIPLVAVGAAVVGMEFGIKLATEGIGSMAESLGKMIASSKGAGPAMLSVGEGIGAISLAMLGFTAGALGFITFAATMHTIAKNADAMVKVGNAFANIKAVMSGSKDDFVAVQNAVESISKMNTKGGGMLADLATLLKEPLKVEFANGGKVTLQNDITLNLSGEKFMHNIYNSVIAIEKQQALKQGKAGK